MILDPSISTSGAIRIAVVGIGNKGCQTLNYLYERNLSNIEFIAIDTDSQSLLQTNAHRRLLLGDALTHGQGTAGNIDVGQLAAEESSEELEKIFEGIDVVFMSLGLGGGTGSGAAPIIASLAKNSGAIILCVLTLPFLFEGSTHTRTAEATIEQLKKTVETIIVIPNDSLLCDNRALIREASNLFAETFYQSVLLLTELLMTPGLINLDLADVRTLLTEGGPALIATGVSTGEDRGRRAAENAIANKIGNFGSFKDAKSIMFSLTGGSDLTLFEVNTAAEVIRNNANQNVNMVFGAIVDPNLKNQVRITILATGSITEPLAFSRDLEEIASLSDTVLLNGKSGKAK
jgi:cell division protein FtsZ